MISVQNTPLLRDGESLFTIPNFILQDHHKVGLLAANGAGKTSFLAALYERQLPHNAVIVYCPQKTPLEMRSQSWNECVLNAPELFDFQQFYDWLDLFHIPADRPLEQLSGGQQRLGMIFYIMSHEATHYFFDEPTNHLDIPTIQWLENRLKKECRSYIIISHDRAFLENVTEGIWAIHEKQLRFYPGNYDSYLEKRLLEEQTLLQQRQKNQIMLAQEERYRERGVTARRKRNQKRVERLHELRQKLSSSETTAQMNMSKVSRGSQGYRPQQIFQFQNYPMKKIDRKGNVHYTSWETTVTREDRIALVGSNGCGKTTFLKELISNQIETILRCRDLEIAFVDQHRQRDPNKTLLEHITDDPHQLIVTTSTGTQMIHPASYLESFGLSREDFSIPYQKLSGGQQMKLCLAIALLKNPDVLILDEPTNDLDQDSLEDLADWLSQYQGLVFFVSHDRYFIDQCATETWYWTKTGVIAHKGGIDPVCLAKLESFEESKKEPVPISAKNAIHASAQAHISKKSDTKTVEKIEKQIEQIEKELNILSEKMAQAYQDDRESPDLDSLLSKQSDLESRLENLMAQWESLSH